MRKPHTHTARDPDRACTNCGRPLKLNVLARLPRAHLCYACWRKLNRRAPR